MPTAARKSHRPRRAHVERARTLARTARREAARRWVQLGFVHEAFRPPRPRTRAECKDGPRPCPWVACRHHLYLDVDPATGAIKINFPRGLGTMKETCALDVVDAHHEGLALEAIGPLLNVTREGVRMDEARGLEAMRRGCG